MEKITVAKAERMDKTIRRQNEKLREGARLGTAALITSLGGGVGAGWLSVHRPTIWGTEVSTAGAVGVGLIMAGMAGWLSDYSDEATNLGSGLLACAIKDESAKYFAEG